MTNKERKETTIKNLRLLQAHIKDKVTDKQFNMISYRNSTFYSKDNCGTVGCAMGWAPFVKGLETLESDFHADGSLNYGIYHNRIFKADTDDLWSFLFCPDWSKHDNTREGFVKRVDYLIERGLEVGWFSYRYFKEGWTA